MNINNLKISIFKYAVGCECEFCNCKEHEKIQFTQDELKRISFNFGSNKFKIPQRIFNKRVALIRRGYGYKCTNK